MAFLKIFKPKWEHNNAGVRLDAIDKLDDSEQDIFAKIILQDQDSKVRKEALSRLSNLPLLEELFKKIDDDILKKDISYRICSIYTLQILGKLDQDLKKVYLNKVSNETLLAEIATKAPETQIRLLAIEKISDTSLLLNIITAHCGKEPGLAALHKISDINLLEEAAAKASSRTVRASARANLTKLRGPDPQELQEMRDKEIEKLLQFAKKLSFLADPEEAHKKFAAVEENWQQLDVEYNSPRALQFKKYIETINNRLDSFTKHKEAEQQKKEKFDHHFTELLEIFNDLSILTDLSEPHFPEDLKNITQQWEIEIAKLSDVHLLPEELLSDYQSLKKANIRKSKKISAERDLLAQMTVVLDKINTCFDEELYDEIPVLLAKCNTLYSPEKFKYLSSEEMGIELSKAQALFDQQQRLQDEAREKLIQDTLAQRQSLIEEVQELTKTEDIPNSDKRVEEIRKSWPTSCDVTTNFKEIDTKFQEAVSLFDEAKKTFYQQKDWQLWTNKNLKEKIITEMISLHDVQDLHLVFKAMKILQERWNKIGEVPAKEENRLWKRYSNASDRNFKRCQKFFNELDALAEVHTEKKLHLIKQAHDHAESTEWNKSTEFLKNLQSQWKEIGRVKKEKEEELFAQFRKECDSFFTRRNEHYKNLSEQRQSNLEIKEKLCLEVEKMVQEPTTECAKKIQEIQKEWKIIGPVPKKDDEKIWKRFRHACNQYYEWLDTLQPDNLLQKEALCHKAKELTDGLDPQYSNLEKISRELMAIQKKWRTIGPAPKPQNNEIWKDFRNICDTFFTKKKNYYAEIDRQRPINEEKKKEYINQVLEHSKSNHKNSVRTIIDVQAQWKSIGPATKKNDRNLDKQFKELCDTFFNARRDTFEELDRIRRENLKKKEELCVKLELLAGIGQDKSPRSQSNTTLTLAEQLKVAFETNFVVSGDEKSSKRRKKDEIVLIQKEWNTIIGDLPKEHEHAILNRYKRALNTCKEQDTQNPKKKE